MEVAIVNIGDSFICIESFEMIGKGVLFTKGKIYSSEHKGCLTNNLGCVRTIVSSSYFDFNRYFKRI